MKYMRWITGTAILLGIVTLIIVRPPEHLFPPGLPHAGFLARAIYIILLSSAMIVYRVWRGPTSADRLVAIDILGILIIGFCAVLTIATRRDWYIDIGIAWALQSFIATLALSKHLEGKGFEE